MDRLTIRNSDGAWDVPLRGEDDGAYFPSQEIIDRLAAYEDTGLEPEEVEAAKKIAEWFTSLFKDAKEWWNDLVQRNKEGDR